MEGTLPELRRFILPGGAKVAALLHQARAVCRRAERWVVVLIREGQTCGFPLTGTPFPKRLRSRQAKLAFARSLTGCPESSISAEDLRNGGVNMNVLVYLNRLSDCLFLAARGVNQAAGKRETEV
jgi:cob(I)alamin adenosyltransferase